jgi:hypothetical protein
VNTLTKLALGLMGQPGRAHRAQRDEGAGDRSVCGAAQRQVCAHAAAGAMAQHADLHRARAGLATVIRGWFDARALGQAMGRGPDQQVLLAQTVGRRAGSTAGRGTA